MDDAAVIAKAHAEDRILITNDKDFGEKVFRDKLPHRGIVLLRLDDERAAVKIETLRQLLENCSERIVGQYVVVTETTVRFAASKS